MRQAVQAGVIGCDHLGELIDLGVERSIIRGASLDPADPESRAAERFMEAVAPLLRG